MRAADVNGCGSVFFASTMCMTSVSRIVRKSEIKARWQRHQTASAHMIAVGPISFARSTSRSHLCEIALSPCNRRNRERKRFATPYYASRAWVFVAHQGPEGVHSLFRALLMIGQAPPY